MVEVLVLHLGLTASPRQGVQEECGRASLEGRRRYTFFHMINYDDNLSLPRGLWVEEVTGTA